MQVGHITTDEIEEKLRLYGELPDSFAIGGVEYIRKSTFEGYVEKVRENYIEQLRYMKEFYEHKLKHGVE